MNQTHLTTCHLYTQTWKDSLRDLNESKLTMTKEDLVLLLSAKINTNQGVSANTEYDLRIAILIERIVARRLREAINSMKANQTYTKARGDDDNPKYYL